MYYVCIVMCFRVKLNLKLGKLKDESRLDFSAPALLPLAHFIVYRVHFMLTYIQFFETSDHQDIFSLLFLFILLLLLEYY